MSEALDKVTKPGALVIPEFLKEVKGRDGFDAMTKEDMVLPRLGICQALSPQRQKDKPSYIQGLSEGDMFNTITGQNYGDKIELIPLTFTKSRIYFRALTEGGGILCSSSNGIDGGSLAPTCAECPNSKFGAEGKQPVCTEFFNYPALVASTKEIVIVSLKSSGLKVAKQWNMRMQMLNKPMYVGVYSFSIVPQKSKGGDFYGPGPVRFARFVTEDEYKLTSQLYNDMQHRNIRVDDSDIEVEEADVVVNPAYPF
jgi:hypothetical protein